MIVSHYIISNHHQLNTMESKKAKNMPYVYVFTQKTDMKFIPETYEQPQPTSSTINKSSYGSRIKSFLGFPEPSEISSQSQSEHQFGISPSILDSSYKLDSMISQLSALPPGSNKIKFVQRIAPEFVLIGNQYQLDLINISNISQSNFVDTEYYWSLKFKQKISSVSVDSKKMNLLAIVVGKKLKIYKYDYKKISHEPFRVFEEVMLPAIPFSLIVARDGHTCVFYKKKYEVYVVGERIRKIRDKKYEFFRNEDNQTFEIYSVPEPYENILNIFFTEKLENENVFTLWSIEMEFQALTIITSEAKKVYEIKSQFKSTMELSNYSRDIFLMNLRNQINAVKHGYILDSATIQMNKGDQCLNYMGNDMLMHISNKMVQLYKFSLNMAVKPSRIKIKPDDSIKIYDDLKQFQFVKIVPILHKQFIIVFQIKQQFNKNKNGEIRYCFFLTQRIPRQEKINMLFPNKGWKVQFGSDDLTERCDIAQKMGMNAKEIYLELWNRTSKSGIQNYQVLIATNDYQTIKNQILKKLKKSSMTFKEIQKIEADCYEMLKTRIFGTSCTEQAVMEYISCHFFLRKLQMFKDQQFVYRDERQIQSIQDKESHIQIIKMNIRQYQKLRSMEIKEELMTELENFCEENDQDAIRKIRFLLRSFRFVFRTKYYDLLQSIIKKSEFKLYQVLKAMPQLLPCVPEISQDSQNKYPSNFFSGVWTEINKRQWDESLYVDAIITIDNRQLIEEKVIKSLIFRRNFLSQHDMITISKEQIEENAQMINSSQTFYFFIATIFSHVKDQQVQKQVIKFIEENPIYNKLPESLKRKIFLIKNLYDYFLEKDLLPLINNEKCTLHQFLKLQDKQFIRHCFIVERSIKGFLLKQIKPIYHEVCGDEGKNMFNQALLSYFVSDLSEVSDLKYILNRINNQNNDFHFSNQQMYEILVEALERKLKLGTDNDIPIEEVLIYIENIPLKGEEIDNEITPSRAMLELQLVERVQEQTEILQAARLNMSVYDILHQPDEVFEKLVSYFVRQGHIYQRFRQQAPQNHIQMSQFTYSTIARLQDLSQEIYRTPNYQKIFLFYLIKLCEEQHMIKYVVHLLKDKNLENCYDDRTAQRLVQYMYQWKMNENNIMIENSSYVNQLLKLIPKDKVTYIYIESQMEYARILSIYIPYEYPITQEAYTIKDLRKQLLEIPVEYLMKMDLQKLYQQIEKLQKIYLQTMQDNTEETFSATNFITLHQIYQLAIIELLHSRKLREVLPYIRKVMEQKISYTTYNIIYPILYIIEISGEINDQNRNLLIRCISFYFYDPQGLLEIIEDLVLNPRNAKEIKEFLSRSLKKGKSKFKGYQSDNDVLSEDYIENIDSPEMEEQFMKSIDQATKKLQQSKGEFNDVKYAAIMAILCNSPYALAKLIVCSEKVNLKAIRCFLSYCIRQPIFNRLVILELGRRIFLTMLESERNSEALQNVIERFSNISLKDEEIEAQYNLNEKDEKFFMERNWWNSAEAFRKKKQKIKQDIEEEKKLNIGIIENFLQKSQRIKKSLEEKSSNGDKQQPDQYPLAQVDDDNQFEEDINIRESIAVKRTNSAPFDPKILRKRALESNSKLMFGSIQQNSPRGQNQFSMTIRGPKQATEENQAFYQSIGFSNYQPSHSPSSKKSNSLSQSYQMGIGPQSPIKIHTGRQKLSKQYLLKNIYSDDEDLEVESESLMSQDLNPGGKYVVKIKEACNQESDEMEVMKIIDENDHQESSPSQYIITPQSIARNLFQQNLDNLVADKDYLNLDKVKRISDDQSSLRTLIQQLYLARPQSVKSVRVLKMIQQIGKMYPVAQVSKDSIQMIIELADDKQKYIVDIAFERIFPVEHLFDVFHSKKDIFQIVSPNLSRLTDSENLYKVCLYVKKAFSDTQLQGLIIWDFIMKLCYKIDSFEEQQANMNLEKIEYTLSKVKLNIWNMKFDSFALTVLNSKCKQNLLLIFCKYLSTATPKEEAKEFLEKLARVEKSQLVLNTLEEVK